MVQAVSHIVEILNMLRDTIAIVINHQIQAVELMVLVVVKECRDIL